MATKKANVDGVGFYESSTLGKIPLSFKGRELLVHLRDKIHEALNVARTQVVFNRDAAYEPISEARGNLAMYMSQLEAKLATKEREAAEVSLQQARQRESNAAELERVRTQLRASQDEAKRLRGDYDALRCNPFYAKRLRDATIEELLAQLGAKLAQKGIT